MPELFSLISMTAALAVGVISPGPSFVMVARVAASQSRRDGIAAALGMGVGGAAFALAALLGLQTLLLAVPSVYVLLKIIGGLYLCYLGYRIFRSASTTLSVNAAAAPRTNARKSFVLGLVTQMSNPKTAIVYASVFAAFLPAQHSFGFDAAVLAVVFAVETAWYAVVALVLSSDGPRATYLSFKALIDRLAGGVMAALGVRLIWSATRP